MNNTKFTLAAVQAEPVYMDLQATVEKACRLIAEAGAAGAGVAVFPEAFLPGYPDWIWYVPAGEITLNQQLYGELIGQSIAVPGPETDMLGQAAKKAGIYVIIGVNERNVEASGGTLYNTLLYFDPDGHLFGRHRKLVPTAPERTIWGYGDPSMLDVYATDLGRMSGLICHENYMPLVRYSLYGQGVELYFAPTYDEGETWRSTIRHIGREGRVYVAGCCMVLRKESVLGHSPQLAPYYASAGDWLNCGNSVIADPNGDLLAGPLGSAEGILLAEVDPARVRGTRWNLDVAGHYARPDAFQLIVNKSPTPLLTIRSNDTETDPGGESESEETIPE